MYICKFNLILFIKKKIIKTCINICSFPYRFLYFYIINYIKNDEQKLI